MGPEVIVAVVIGVALVVYSLTGGADFGGGVWDLLAFGPRKVQQRRLVATTIGPIWEANHVWLILVIVLLWTCFPKAYATIGAALHLPLTAMLIGIVLRGSSFVFRAYDSRRPEVQERWSAVFHWSSVVTPVLLGVSVGAVASGQIRIGPGMDFFGPWLQPFPWAVGVFTLALFAFLAAVYLAVEAEDEVLQEDFRARAIGSVGVVFVMAWVSLFLARTGAPQLFDGLLFAPWSPVLHLAIAGVGLVGFWSLWTRRFRLTRALAAGQVALVVVGFALAMVPYLIVPDVTLSSAKAPDNVLWLVLGLLALGAAPLLAAYAWLMRIFVHVR